MAQQDTLIRVINYLKADVWRISTTQYSTLKTFWIKQLQVMLLAIHKFRKDKSHLRASALTFYTLLSIVPVIAMAFGIAKGFGFEKLLEKQLLTRFPAQQEDVAQVINFAQSLLETTKGGMIAGVGVVLLFWSAMKVLNHIEGSFNDIWEIKRARPIGRKLSNYFAIMFICPLLIILSSSATVFITTQVTLITQRVALLGFFSPVIAFFLKLFPYCLIWILFTFIYILIPSTKVNFASSLLAGFVAGTVYQVVYWAYIIFQVGISRHNAIYGSFAALPLFLVWLHNSWLIVLMGAQLSFAHQNRDKSELGPDAMEISSHFKKILALQIVHLLVKQFQKGERPLSVEIIAARLQIPLRLASQLIQDLVECRIVSDTIDHANQALAYQPARDINMLNINYILRALEQNGVPSLPVAETPALKMISESLQSFGELIENTSENKLLKDI